MDDWQLIQDYVGRDSEIAFSTLVERYLNLVYSVALRQTRDSQLAEEVAQAVFILLARKARGLRHSTILSGWLFRTTRFVANRAVRAEQRRLRREQESYAMQQFSTPDHTWKRVSTVLDDALERLGETDRNALLLRFFNDKSFRETALALGLSEDAAKKRVARALDKLRNFFSKQGVTLSVSALASLLATNAAKAATPEIATSVVSKLIISGTPTFGSSSLVAQTLSAWRWMRLKIAGAGAVAVLMAVLLLEWLTNKPSDLSQTPSAAAGASFSGAFVANPRPTGFEQSDSPFTTLAQTNGMLFRVMEVQTGVGINGARVVVNYVSGGKWWGGHDLTTDAEGICRVEIPDNLVRLDVGVLKDGYVQKFYTWRSDYEQPLPSVYSLRVERAVAIGGYCRDQAGEAISDAEIMVMFAGGSDATFREPQPERLGFVRELVIARSDAQGRWQCAVVPPNYDQFQVRARHPQFVNGTFLIDRRYAADSQPRPDLKTLLAFEAVIVLRPGIQISGMVLDDAGQPLRDATVSRFDQTGWPLDSMTTKADGLFRLHGIEGGQVSLGASAPGFAPASQTLDLQSNVLDMAFQLSRGTNVSIRVVDEQGDAVVGAWVAAEGPLKHNADWSAKCDAQGWAQIKGIPEMILNRLWFHAGAKGFFTARNQSVNLSATEPTIQLLHALRVSGRVIDAVSGEPVSWFKTIPCRSEGLGGYDRSERKFGTNGNFVLTFNEYQTPFRVLIEAEGYEPMLSLPLSPAPSEQSIELKLLRKDPSKTIRGIVLSPEGQPAVNAEVALLTFERGASLFQGRFLDDHSILTRTDFEGRFQFESDIHAHTIAVAHDAGFGRTRIRPEDKAVTVQLTAWGKIEGTVRTRDRQWSARDVALTSPHSEAGFSVSAHVKSADDGSFLIDRLPPGDYTLHLNPGRGRPFTHTTATEVRGGETSRVQVGGTGATVTGKLEYAVQRVDWKEQTRLPSLQPTNSPPPAPLLWQFDRRSSDPEGRRKRLDQVESDAWGDWARSQRHVVMLEIASDGSFVAEGMRAGKYTLRVDLTAGAEGSRQDIMASLMQSPIASIRIPVEISDAQEQLRQDLDLGVLTMLPEVQNSDEAKSKLH